MLGVPDKIPDNSPEVKIDICDNSVLISGRVPEFTGRGSGCLPKCSGATTLYMGQRGKAHEVLENAKGSFVTALSSTTASVAVVLPPKQYYRYCSSGTTACARYCRDPS